ncbi:hypothetical protein ACP275_02G046800 [Erythranthe tilingii]
MRLLTDIREESGLEPPTCFTMLPKDLKLKILESFSITELANVSRVNSEMRCSASCDELWRLKFVEEFGDDCKNETRGSWKEAFATARQRSKDAELVHRYLGGPPRQVIGEDRLRNRDRFRRGPPMIDEDLLRYTKRARGRGRDRLILPPNCRFYLRDRFM